MIGQYYQVNIFSSDHKMSVILESVLDASPLRCPHFPPLIMYRKTLLSNLKKEVTCFVCNKAFTDPKTLPCLHTFCLHCLTKEIQTNGDHDLIACRKCRKVSRIVRGGLYKLPTNYRIRIFLDVLAIKESNTATVQCENCDKKSSQCFYCFPCCAFWCEPDCIL